MYNPQKHAQLLASYCLEARAGESILIFATTAAEPLVTALYQEILHAGAYPVLRLEYPEQKSDFIARASDELLDTPNPITLFEAQQCAASTRIEAPQAAQSLDAHKQQRLAKALRPALQERMSKRWNVTLFPTVQGAQHAEMTLEQYQQFVHQAMFLHHDDPVQAWLNLSHTQNSLVERLQRGNTLRIVNAHTDLSMNISGRTWANSDGKHNMPSGEVFSAPLEDSVNGYIYYDLPTLYQGQEVQGIHLTFKNGKVTRASAEKGEDVLHSALSVDEGASWVGEIGIGTNYGIQSPSKNILFDEKIGGTVHLALGQSYAHTGGKNHSSIHWDMICDLRQGGEILLDGAVFQANGVFWDDAAIPLKMRTE